MHLNRDDTKRKIGRLFRPYGEWGGELGRKMCREKVNHSPAFHANVKKFCGNLKRGMWYGVALGATLSLLNAFNLLETNPAVKAVMSYFAHIEGYCETRQPRVAHTLWLLIMHSYTVFILIQALSFVPRDDWKTGAETIPKIRHLVVAFLCSCIASFAFYYLSMKLLLGCKQEGRIFSHADFIFRAFTNSDFGLITVGPFIWAAGPMVWLPSLWICMCATYRIFILRKSNLDY